MHEELKQNERLNRFLTDIAHLYRTTLIAMQEDLIELVAQNKNCDGSSKYINCHFCLFEFACHILYFSDNLLKQLNFCELRESILSTLKDVLTTEVDKSAMFGSLEHSVSFYMTERMDAYSRALNGTIRPKGVWWVRTKRTVPAPRLLLGDHIICSMKNSRPATNSDLETLSSDFFEARIIAQIISFAFFPNMRNYMKTLGSLCSEYSLNMYYNT